MAYSKNNRWQYKAISAYEEVLWPLGWLPCPNCGLRPLVWEFDNGMSTACGCGENEYRHFSIHAESIMSVIKRNNGSCIEYDNDALRKNWNHWVKTGEELFVHAGKRNDGKW